MLTFSRLVGSSIHAHFGFFFLSTYLSEPRPPSQISETGLASEKLLGDESRRFTVFAPTDEAWEDFFAGALGLGEGLGGRAAVAAALQNDKEQIKKVSEGTNLY